MMSAMVSRASRPGPVRVGTVSASLVSATPVMVTSLASPWGLVP
jgi:hypothetical protein